jgi:hypothetical protein
MLQALQTGIAPFELWREEGVLRLVFCNGSRIGPKETKELFRYLSILDGPCSMPLVVENEERVRFDPSMLELAQRVCRRKERPLALLVHSMQDRAYADACLAARPAAVPAKVFYTEVAAMHWAQQWLLSPGLRLVRAEA